MYSFMSASAVRPRSRSAAVNADGKSVFPVTFDMGLANCKVTNITIDKVSKPCVDLWTNERGNLVLWLASTSSQLYTITITAVDDAGEETKKSWGYKVDDDGNYEFSRDVLTVDGEPIVGGMDASGSGWDYNSGTGIMMFRSGSHEISGNSTNGTIRVVANGGDVKLTIKKRTLKTPATDLSPFVVSNRCTLTLVDESVIECICNPKAESASGLGSRYTAGIEVPEGMDSMMNQMATEAIRMAKEWAKQQIDNLGK